MKKVVNLLAAITLAFSVLLVNTHTVQAESIGESSSDNAKIISVYRDNQYRIVPYERGPSYKGGQPRKGTVKLNRKQWIRVLNTYFEMAKVAIWPYQLPWSIWSIMKACHNV